MSQPNNLWTEPRRRFMLAADETYLNAGTFSALPRVVYDELIAQLAAAELNPTRQAAANGREPLWKVQTEIARYVGAQPADLVFHHNVTQALNQAFFCLPWREGGEFLVSDQEYGAVANAAREMCRRRGLNFRKFQLPLQPQTGDDLFNAVIHSLTPDTRGVLLSHITCSTGIRTPIERLATELRQRNVRFIVDGAHGPGLVPLQLAATDIDIYGGNLHKWFMGPKGTGFLYVAPHLRGSMEPHIVGWGSTPHDRRPIQDPYAGNAERFQYVFRMQGLLDFAPFLALPATLRFRESLGETAIQQRIAHLCRYARERLGLKCLSLVAEFQAGLIAFEPPPAWRVNDATERLYRDHKISVPFWPGGRIMRVSPHIWNTEADIDRLAAALTAPLP